MIQVLTLWLVLCFLSFGIPGLTVLLKKRRALTNWNLNIDPHYKPTASIIVPTYNEAGIIRYKLQNLRRLEYTKDLMQIIVLDSNSEDGTIDILRDFAKESKMENIEILIETERKGKSAALNLALQHYKGEIVIISDADCFWPPDVLSKSVPFLADENVGGISGPKILLNAAQSWVTRMEDRYLTSMNLMKLGESKTGSTPFFEGGFSAYRKPVLEAFDPYETGSDDCSTIIALLEKNFRAIFVPEARFFTTFPKTWRGRTSVKMRRSNQLPRVLWKHSELLRKGRIKNSKGTVIQGIFNYFIAPIVFVMLFPTTVSLFLISTYLVLILLVFLVPRVGSYAFEVTQDYIMLFASMFFALFKKRFLVWDKPDDRILLEETALLERGLI